MRTSLWMHHEGGRSVTTRPVQPTNKAGSEFNIYIRNPKAKLSTTSFSFRSYFFRLLYFVRRARPVITVAAAPGALFGGRLLYAAARKAFEKKNAVEKKHGEKIKAKKWEGMHPMCVCIWKTETTELRTKGDDVGFLGDACRCTNIKINSFEYQFQIKLYSNHN